MTSPQAPSQERRRWLAGGAVGALAAASGIGVALWREQAQRPAPVPAETLPLWSARFARPQGGELVLSEFLGRPLVLNFWATWCPPCVKEMPELDRFAQAYAGQGWQVLGLAIDNQRAVQEFLLRVPVKFHIGLAGLAGSELGRALGNERGLLPYTLLLSRDGAIVQRKFGPTDFNELSAWAKAMG